VQTDLVAYPDRSGTLSDADSLIVVATGMAALYVDSAVIQAFGLIFAVAVAFTLPFLISEGAYDDNAR
jgi:hypothetical protein